MIITPQMANLASRLKKRANADTCDYFTDGETPYSQSCTGYHAASGTILRLTRDVGHHSCGWIKNPDYERCYHLSLSFRDRETFESEPHNRKAADRWCEALFRHHKRWLWIEGPKSAYGRKLDVWHYRLLCDEAWQPIYPRGEVYSREHTPADWMTWSERTEKQKPDVPTGMTP